MRSFARISPYGKNMPHIFEQTKYTKIIYWLLGGMAFTCVMLVAAIFAPQDTASTELYFLDIGQGDSQLIQLPGGTQILIDGGPSGARLLDNLAKVMPPQDRYIDLLIMTHPEADHFTGFIELLKKYQVGVFMGNLRKRSTAPYAELHRQLEEHQIPYIQILEGDTVAAGDARLHILGPSRKNLISKELNDSSVVVLLEAPQFKVLYTGDIGVNIENELVARYGKELNVDVLKVGHHGSRFSSGVNFLKATSPAAAVIEVGKNTYGHPTKQAIDRLAAGGAKVLRTDKEGIIKITGGESLKMFGLR